MSTAQMQDIVNRATAVGADDISTSSWRTLKGKTSWKVGFSVGARSYGWYATYSYWDRILTGIERKG